MKDPTLELIGPANLLARHIGRASIQLSPTMFECMYVWRASAFPAFDSNCSKITLVEDGPTSMAALEGLIVKMKKEAVKQLKVLSEETKALQDLTKDLQVLLERE